MDENNSFSTELFAAIEEKASWYDTEELPEILTSYRNLHAHVANLINTLTKKGVISEDPYKHDKKISDIETLDESVFADTERQIKISTRLSDFDSMLDFICNYLKFSVPNLTPDRLKKLAALNNYFQWGSLVVSSHRPNTRGLAEILTSVRQGSDTLSAKVVNDSVANAAKCILRINAGLKELGEFQREIYKCEIRKNVLKHPSFSEEQAAASTENALMQIKKIFPAALGKFPFYPELIDEIIKEEYAPDHDIYRKAVLAKLAVRKKAETKKETGINTHALLLEAVRSITAMTPQLEQVLVKIQENKNILDSENNSFWTKFMAVLRKAFNIKEEPVTYRLTLADSLSQTNRVENIVIQDFIHSISRRIKYYTAFSLKRDSGFQKIEAMPDEKIMEMLSTQLSECQHLLVTLNALDVFFKTTAQPLNRSKIKGMKIELTAVKNVLVKTNQRKAEYIAVIEEQAQMRKLGITNV